MPLAPPPAAYIAPPPAFSPASTTQSSNPFDTPPVSRPPSPSQLPHPLLDSLIDAESLQPSGASTPATSRASSWSRAGSQSRDPLFKKTQIGRQGTWGALKQLSPFGGGGGEAPRGRRMSSNAGEMDMRSGIRTAMGEVEGRSAGRGRTLPMSRDRAQMVVAFLMIALVGMNDSATGANLSSMQSHYGVTYDQISIVFLANVAGYFVSCVSSSFLTHHLGLQWSLVVAAGFLSTGCLIIALAPPYGLFVSSLALLGFGSGLYDSCLTTVVSHSEDGVLMSCMYACFGVGAMFSPLIIGGFVDADYNWNYYYYIPLGVSLLLALVAFPVFSTYKAPVDEHHPDMALTTIPAPEEGEVVGGRAIMSVQQRMKQALKMRAVWAGFLLIVIAFGTSDTLSAWMVSFMVEKRHSPEAASRYQLAGLWGGIALGRVTLAFVGRKMGEKMFAVLLLALASACLGVVWAVKNVPINAVALVLVGFFIGPVTPKVLSTVSARVPTSLKSSVMSLTIGLGLIGSGVGPLAFGAVAEKGGLGLLPAVLIGASVIAMGAWMLVPKKVRRDD